MMKLHIKTTGKASLSGSFRRTVCMLLFICTAAAAAAAGKFVLVIDAGHGGKDAGCVGKKSKEKDLTLKYATAFGRMVERNCPDVKVVYTRTTDRFLELWQRAEIANKQKADLFLSFHINSVSGSTAVRGYQTYTLGRGESTGKKGIKENLEVAKRENSVISMEKDYKQRYQGFDPNSPESNILFEFIQDANMERSVDLARLMQKHVCQATGRADRGAHQNNLAVLRLTSMPGCLLELGFISNPDEETFLNASSSVELYSRGILKAFMAYKSKYFDGLKGGSAPSGGKTTAPAAATDKKEVANAVAEKPNTTVKEEPRAEAKRKSKDTAAAVTTAKNSEKADATAPKLAESEPSKPAEDDKTKASTAASEPSSGSQSSAPVFKVQILTGRTQLKAGDKQFKGLSDVESYEENGAYKYTVGSSTDYNEISQLRRNIIDKFPEAFIVAFKDGSRMNVHEAITEFKQSKK